MTSSADSDSEEEEEQETKKKKDKKKRKSSTEGGASKPKKAKVYKIECFCLYDFQSHYSLRLLLLYIKLQRVITFTNWQLKRKDFLFETRANTSRNSYAYLHDDTFHFY